METAADTAEMKQNYYKQNMSSLLFDNIESALYDILNDFEFTLFNNNYSYVMSQNISNNNNNIPD